MDKKTISITNKDTSTTKITIVQSLIDNTPIIIIFPAMGVRGSYYETLAETLAKEGFTAVMADLRGHGNSSVRPSRKVNFGYKEMLELDYESIITKIEELYPNKPIHILGHSLGGQIGGLFASKYPDRISGLIFVACCSVYYKGWEKLKSIQILFATQLLNWIANILGYLPGNQIGFGGLEARGVLQDWSRQARTGKYILKGDDFDYEKAMNNLQIPILAISFTYDNLAPKNAVTHLIQKFKKSVHQHIDVAKDSNEKKYTHFNWAKHPAEIVTMIKKWK